MTAGEAAMGKRAWLALAGTVSAFLLFIVAAQQALAFTQFRSGSSITIASGETVNSSLWAGATNLDISGTVNGDVLCGAQTVNISGSVTGDVVCGAQTITISGTVGGSVRLGAQTVNISGNIGRNTTIGAQTINIGSKAQIAGDAAVAANNVNLNGKLGRDLSAAASNLNIAGEVGRDITGKVSYITLASGAKVGGSIDYTSEDKIAIGNGATVGGQVTQHQPKQEHKSFLSLLFFSGAAAIFLAIALIVSALIITALLPQFVHGVSTYGIRRPWWALLIGFLASIIVPVVFILLLITFVGIPLALLLLLSWLLIGLLSGLFASYYLGRLILRNQRNPLLIILAGSVVLVILYFIPFVNILALVLATWLGEGMLLLWLKDHRPSPKYRLD
jgi:cytoskeletal protein CcmA (bactofilin family)